jgi:hypothetical protein
MSQSRASHTRNPTTFSYFLNSHTSIPSRGTEAPLTSTAEIATVFEEKAREGAATWNRHYTAS